MQSVLLRVDESIDLTDFVHKIQSLYGNKKIEHILNIDEPAKSFGDFHMFSREELNERFPPEVDTKVWKFDRGEANER